MPARSPRPSPKVASPSPRAAPTYHLMLVDLRPKKLTGKAAEACLTRSHITCNKNGVPFDPEKPMVTSGIRLGTPRRYDTRLRCGRVPGSRAS